MVQRKDDDKMRRYAAMRELYIEHIKYWNYS